MKKQTPILLFLLILAVNLVTLPAYAVMNNSLTEVIDDYRLNGKMIPVVIELTDQYDTDALYREVSVMSKQQRREHTVNRLQLHSERTQASLRAKLSLLEKDGEAANIRYFWIVNAIGLEASYEALETLSAKEGINTIFYDAWENLLISEVQDYDDNDDERVNRNEVKRTSERETRNPAANVTRVRAPQIWEQGFRGEAVTVAVLDTGVNYNHRDLVDNMWTHPDYPNHGYNFVANNNDPMDDNGHGSHCAGTVAGDGTSGTLTGVAPSADIMAIKVLAANGSGNFQSVVAGIEFSVENGADILSVSLGFRRANTAIRRAVRQTMVNAMNAGVVASVAVGNEGRNPNIPENVRTPGNCPAPWQHPDQTLQGGQSAVVSVGATDNADRRANFSSVGPVTWSNVSPFEDYPYNPGMGLLVPDVMAPGVNVVSLRHNSNTGYRSTSGTSMAAPAVAGIMALMISKDPEITPEDISRILEETTVASPETKNGTFGSGRADAFNAVEEVVGTAPPNQAIRPSPEPGTQYVGRRPTLEWSNGGGARSYRVYVGTDNPPSNTVAGHQTDDRDYTLTVDLEPQQTYYWRIDSVNDNGVTAGEVWHFETSIPQRVTNPEPADGSDDARLLPTLRWIEQGGSDSYKVYLGTDNPPTDFLNGVEVDETSYNLEQSLDSRTLYYWRIDAVNVNGAAEGEVWSFTTGEPAGETFASGDFSANPWELSYTGDTEAYWLIDDIERYSGDYAARAGHLQRGTTTIAITLEVYESGSISFARKVYSHRDHSLVFYIGNNEIARWSGDHDWDEVTFDVEPGVHNFRWVYDKTRPGYLENDGAWIDHITFPYLGIPSPHITPPVNLSSEAAYDHISLNWELPLERPVILGHNIFRSFDGEDFEKVNERLFRSNYFNDDLLHEGDYHYYVTSVFENGESGPSEIATVSIGEAVSEPEFSHQEGEYSEGFDLTIKVENEDTVVFYTLDGAEPDPDALLYDGAIEIHESTLVRARAYSRNRLPSDMIEGDFIITLSVEDDFAGTAGNLTVYPNPVLSQNNVRIAYSLISAQQTSVNIYNIKGRLVRSFDGLEASLGNNSLVWDMRDDRGHRVGTGIYLINFRTSDKTETKRLMIMK